MSASLVGSEMCIRDSPEVVLTVALARLDRKGALEVSLLPGEMEEQIWGCLLYTSDAADDM
eukprot:8711691-Alexandrium_andersonii.AAC.1